MEKNKKGAPSIRWIRERTTSSRYQISEHVIRYLTEGEIGIRDIEAAIANGRIIEYHLNPDRPGSSLVLGYSARRPVHVLCACVEIGWLVIPLAYMPGPPIWKDAKTRNKSGGINVNDNLKTCFFCGGHIKDITIGNFDYRIEGELYVLKEVPAGLCLQCGEKYVSAEVAKRINELVDAGQYSGCVEVPVLRFEQ